MSAIRMLASLFLLFWWMVEACATNECRDLARALGQDALKDGVTYIYFQSVWQPLSSVAGLGLTRPVTLRGAVIVRDGQGRPRDGVVVIKSGRFGTAAASRRVTLVRRDSGRCAPGIANAAIAAEVYDGFHDYGFQRYDSASLQKLRNFHVEYGPGCTTRTDDDPGGAWRHVSNRASFSYTEDVVDNGGYTGLEATAARVHIGRAANAQQAAQQYVERTTEIKPYETTAAGVACIPVTVQYVNEGSFFRTNDLSGPIIDGVRERRYWGRH